MSNEVTEKPVRQRRRVWRVAVWITLAILLLPYLFSRAASPWRKVSVHQLSPVSSPKLDGEMAQIRIVAFNIAHGRALAESNWRGTREQRAAHLDRIAEQLRAADADLVVLNEVDFECSWSHSLNQAQYLAQQAGYSYWAEQRNYDCRLLFWKWRCGNAVLSKLPITHAEAVSLPRYSLWESLVAGRKGALLCDLQHGQESVRVIGAHLESRSEPVRVASADQLAQLAAASPAPMVLAGDLNSTPPGFPQSSTDKSGRNAMAVLDKTGLFRRLPADAPASPDQFTFHATSPHQVIDWILIPRQWQFDRYGVTASELSDHRMVYATVSAATLDDAGEPTGQLNGPPTEKLIPGPLPNSSAPAPNPPKE